MMLDRKSTTSEFLHNLFQQYQLDLVPEIELGSNDLLIDLAASAWDRLVPLLHAGRRGSVLSGHRRGAPLP